MRRGVFGPMEIALRSKSLLYVESFLKYLSSTPAGLLKFPLWVQYELLLPWCSM
jgi:hypothetical protein